MKRPYTGESWTRFKELMQNLIKRTAIVETRAQNNEDDIAELQPAVSDLQEFADNVNDITTMPNLLRGTLDWRQGTIKTSFTNLSYFEDGFTFPAASNYSILTDDQGRKILNIHQSGVTSNTYRQCISSVFAGCKSGETYTYAFDFMVDDVNTWNVKEIGSARQITSANTIASSVVFGNFIYDPDTMELVTMNGIKSKKWYRIIAPLVFTGNADESYGSYCFWSLPQNGSINIREPLAYHKRIERPEWNVNPLDYQSTIDTLDTEHGGTGWKHGLNSGVNLVPGTSNEWSEWIEPKKNSSNVTGAFVNVPFPKLRNKYDIYTRYIEIEFENVTVTSGQTFNFSCQGVVNSTWNYSNPSNLMFALSSPPENGIQVFSNSIVYNEQKVDELENFTIGYRADFWASGRFRYRCLKIERGYVDYPQWTPAPTDVASIQVEKSIPRYLGLIPSSHIITQSIDMNTFVEPGQYLINGNAIANGCTNMPPSYTEGSCVVTIGYKRPISGSEKYIFQRIEPFNSPTVWERICQNQPDNSYKFIPWAKKSDINGYTPIEGGGTGGNSVHTARTNLRVDNSLETNPVSSIDNDLRETWKTKTPGMYIINSMSMYGQPSQYGMLFNYVNGNDVAQVFLANSNAATKEKALLGIRRVNGDNAQMPYFHEIYSHSYSPYIPGIYTGQNIATKFSNVIGSNHVANWLASRASNGNFEGINIGDWVDIACTGATRRYVIAAIDPYYNCGYPTHMSHHLLMIPITRWILDKTRDGDYYTDNSNGTIRWNKTNTNNGTSTVQSPYMSSNLHKWETEVAINQFPQQWQDVMIDRIEMVETRYSASSTLNSPTGQVWQNLGKLWSLSEVEVYGACFKSDPYYNNGVSTYLPIFSNPKFAKNNLPSTWLRDVSCSTSDSACILDAYGPKIEKPVTNNTAYPAPCFLLG